MNKIIKNISKITRRYIKKATQGHYRRINSQRLTQKDYTIFSSNCIGGIINHRVGQAQNSPTFNLWLRQSEFIEFLSNPHYWLEQDLVFVESEYQYPVAVLGKGGGNTCLFYPL